jgi:hypothetical protein
LEVNDVVNKKQSALDAAIRAGRVRISPPSCVYPTENSPAPSSDSADGSESDRQTLLLIAQIVADGDKAINKLNACISAYEEVRKTINKVEHE